MLEQRSRESQARSEAAIAVIVVGVPLAFAILAITGLVFTRSIANPLRTTALVAERMARGDLSTEVPAGNRQDEVGVLLRSFARMAVSARIVGPRSWSQAG